MVPNHATDHFTQCTSNKIISKMIEQICKLTHDFHITKCKCKTQSQTQDVTNTSPGVPEPDVQMCFIE